MIIVDTNVLSETLRQIPDPAVVRWFAGSARRDIHTTAITEAEMRLGVERMPAGRRRDQLATAVENMFELDLRNRVLPFTRAGAPHLATLMAERSNRGQPVAFSDGLIGAICRQHGATLATRNPRDFEDCGIALVNPWD